MGHHYVPRKYLKGFTEDCTDFVWVYEKGSQRTFKANVTKVGQETGYYSPYVEEFLANEVESPGHGILQRIRERKPISADEKRSFTNYIVALIKRGPSSKQMLIERAPLVTGDLVSHFEQEISARRILNPSKSDFYEKRLSEIRSILERLAGNPPESVWESNIPPNTTPNVVEVISKMTWRFLVFRDSASLLTSDNPVFWFKETGLGNPASELYFPISSDIGLWTSWRMDLADGYASADQGVSHALNRRTANNAVRYVYHCANEAWISRFINKKHHLNPLKLGRKKARSRK